MNKIVGVVTVYYPDIVEVASNINTYLPALDCLIIWENTPASDSRINDLIALLTDKIKIKIKGTGANEGLAKPFNDCIRWADSQGYDFLLTMDQDSAFSGISATDYLQRIVDDKEDRIAVYSPDRENRISVYGASFREVGTAITSGAVYPLRIFNQLGYFREDFFIYMVDIEFCLRARSAGYCIVSLPNVCFSHREGYAERSKPGFVVNHYPAQSTYYIIRNTILCWKLFPKDFPWLKRLHFIRYKIAYRTVKLIFEIDKLRKLKAIYIGLWHGIIRKSGYYKI